MDLLHARRNKTERSMRTVRERERAIITYRAILNTMLREIRYEYEESVKPAYVIHTSLVQDDESWFSRLRARVANSISSATAKVTTLIHKENKSHGSRFAAAIKRSTGVDLTAFFGGGEAGSIIEDYIGNNASLIRSLGEDTGGKIERILYRAKRDKTSLDELSLQIQKAFKVSRNRANLIASDQMSSLNASLNERRARVAGMKEYFWTNRKDDRVRDLHELIDGLRYVIGERTGAEFGLPPGGPVNCRCVAKYIIPRKLDLLPNGQLNPNRPAESTAPIPKVQTGITWNWNREEQAKALMERRKREKARYGMVDL